MVFNWWISYFHKKSFEHLKDLFNYENSCFIITFITQASQSKWKIPKNLEQNCYAPSHTFLKHFLLSK